MHRSMFPALVTCAGVWLAAGAAAHAASAPQPTRPSFVVQPAPDQPQGEIGRGYFSLATTAGQAHTFRALVKNTGKAPLSLRNYLVDGAQVEAGGVGYTNWGKHLSGAGSWITLQPKTLRLAPGETRTVTATVHAPASLGPGDYAGGLAFEDTHGRSQRAGSQFMITMLYREVIPVLMQAPGARVSAASIGGATLRPYQKGSVLQITVRNTGNVLWRGKGTARIGGKAGSGTALPFAVGTILPKAQAQVALPLPNVHLQPGSYHLDVQVQSDAKSPRLSWQAMVPLTLPQTVRVAVPTLAPSVALQPAQAPAAASQAPAAPLQAAPAMSVATTDAQGISPLLLGVGGALVLLLGAGMGVVLSRRRPAVSHA